MNPFTLQQKQATLPKVAAPSLDGLTVTVRKPTPITEDDVLLRLMELQRLHATVIAKKKGDAVAVGDEVCINLLGYAKGKLVPRSPQFEAWMVAGADTSLPELTKALALAKVGESLKVQLTLPANFHVEALRGVPALYLVDVLEAQTLTLPAADDKAFLQRLGASSVPDAFARIAKDLTAQRTLRASYEAMNQAVTVAAARAEVKVSPALLKQELWNLWRENEGKPLSDHGLVGSEQTESFEGWQQDPAVVADVEQRLKNSIVIGAIAEAHQGELTAERLAQSAARWSTLLGVPPEEIASAKESSGEERSATAGLLLQLATAELVLERAAIAWV